MVTHECDFFLSFFHYVVIQFIFLCLFIDICLYYSTSSCTCMIMMTNYTVIYMYLNMLLIFSGVRGSYITCIHVQSHYVLKGKLSEEGGAISEQSISNLYIPMANDDKFSYIHSTNNDMLTKIDPNVNNMNPNSLKYQCENYDTSIEFNETVAYDNNISILHRNICSSIKKLNDFMYYINNLDTTFHFIGFSETWASDSNKDLLSIPGYSHKQCIRTNLKKGGGTSVYIHNQIQYKKGMI